LKTIKYIFLSLFGIFIVLLIWFFTAIQYKLPEVENIFDPNERKLEIGDNIYIFQDSWLKKNKYGLWEMFVAGDAFSLGYKKGILADSLIHFQEEVFIKSIRDIIPSKIYLNILKYFVAFFNRNIDNHVPLELLQEIYGVSLFASEEFNFVGEPYMRMLNYHAAHDIGHALQNMNLVACTAFEVKADKSKDSTMIIGRNMDFSSGDDFAKNKIIAFYKPQNGYNFCFITWGGMIGVISGMNEQGLVVSLNAAKSEIPTSAKTPVSLLARHVLQFASNIDEAYKIIEKYDVFVSESFLISSANDLRTVVIEKSINDISIYQTDSNSIILTNHYQSQKLRNTKINIESINEGASKYRWQRVNELLNRIEKHDVESFAEILRDQRGLNDKDIGMGNEKAINQLIAHHSVIFKPEKLQIWVSNYPYQLGRYLCYDLNVIFNEDINIFNNIFDTTYTIKEDSFLYSKQFEKFNEYKIMTKDIKSNFRNKKVEQIPLEKIEFYEQLNPKYFYTYYLIGKYYMKIMDYSNAKKYFEFALSMEIPNLSERKTIINKIIEIEKIR